MSKFARMRCKFIVSEAADIREPRTVDPTKNPSTDNPLRPTKVREKITLRAVYATGKPTAENVSYAKSTPNGMIELHVDNEAVWGWLEPGAVYYVDIIPAPKNCTKCHGGGVTWERSTQVDCDRCGTTGIDPDQS